MSSEPAKTESGLFRNFRSASPPGVTGPDGNLIQSRMSSEPAKTEPGYSEKSTSRQKARFHSFPTVSVGTSCFHGRCLLVGSLWKISLSIHKHVIIVNLFSCGWVPPLHHDHSFPKSSINATDIPSWPLSDTATTALTAQIPLIANCGNLNIIVASFGRHQRRSRHRQ